MARPDKVEYKSAEDFSPTPTQLFPPGQCEGIVRSGPRAGMQCRKPRVQALRHCASHGAQLPNSKKAALERKEAALLRLYGVSEDAADTIIELMDTATSEAVRLKAAESVLDRSGIRVGTELRIEIEDNRISAAELVRDRMQKLRDAAEHKTRELEQSTIDAELVDEEEEELQETEESENA